MIILKNTTDYKDGVISNHDEVKDLCEAIRSAQFQNTPSQRIFVWSGFGREISTDFLNEDNWQQNFVGLFSNQEIWPWKYKFTASESDQLGNLNLMKALSSPSVNIIASLRIRDFQSNDPFQGSLEWFEEIIPYLNDEYYESKILIDRIIHSLQVAKEVGINLLLEKLSLMVCNDPDNSITLTPQLHRDGAYGYLESAIVSFYSERITPNSSTLFLPNFDLEAASHLKPITAEKLIKQFPGTIAYSLASGSLAIFSGKLANDGSKSDLRGALHISPEGFVPTRRLALLFRSKISC